MAVTEHVSDQTGDSAGAATADATQPAPPRAGELSNVWRVVMVVAWVGVVLSWSAVWGVATQLGQSTWWLGTRASPTSPLVRLAPFAGPVAVVIGAITNVRRLAWLGAAAALVFVGYGLGDVLGRGDDAAHLGSVEFGVGTAALVVSLAALTGTYRNPRAPAGTAR